MDGILHGSKVPGEHISAIDDGQHGIHQLAIVDAALEGSR
jgi:hypothetical protein